jgi:hypothetical protein
MTGLRRPAGMLNLIRAVLGIHHHRFNLFVKPIFNTFHCRAGGISLILLGLSEW